jgi:hypothetical protein
MYNAIVPILLVFYKTNKLTPTHIADRLGKRVVFNHTAYVQIFKRDVAVLVNKISTQLVMKVSPLIGDSFVRHSDGVTRLTSVVGTFLLVTQSTLANLQAPHASLEIPWVINLLAC